MELLNTHEPNHALIRVEAGVEDNIKDFNVISQDLEAVLHHA